jgi:hypothetical protein
MAIDTSPRTYRFLPVDVLAFGYRAIGKIMVSSTGAIGILNDPTHSVLDVHDVRTGRLGLSADLLDHFELVRMVKRQIAAVLFGRREDLGPQALVRGGFATSVEYPVRFVMHMFEIEAALEFPGRFDFSALMVEGSREFIPVFNATLKGIGSPDLRLQAGGMLLNRRHIELAGLLNQKVRPQAT